MHLLPLALVLSLCSAVSTAASPDTVSLIAAMPEAIESVAVVRFTDLTVEDSVFKAGAEQVIMARAGVIGPSFAFRRELWTQLAEAGIEVHALGGSHFEGPADRGHEGRFVERAIFVTRDRLQSIEDGLAGGAWFGAQPVSTVEDVPVYQIETPVEGARAERDAVEMRPRFVAVVGGTRLVLADQREDVEHMVRALSAPATTLPDRWKRFIATEVLAAPLLVARIYDDTNPNDPLSPVNPRLPEGQRLPIEGYTVALPDVTEAKLRMRCRTERTSDAVTFYGSLFGTSPLEWRVETNDDGFDATFPVAQAERPEYLFLQLPLMFGQLLYI